MMSETATIIDRDAKNGRFLSGCKPGPGRSPGSRGKLASDFLRDLHSAWNEHGVDALARCAKTEPGVFCKIVAGLMPRDIAVSVTGTIDVADFASRFRSAVELLHEPEMRSIEHADARQRR